MKNHHDYEEERLDTTPEDRKAELRDRMAKEWLPVQVPAGFTPPETRPRR